MTRKFLVACFAAVLVVAGTSFVNAVPVNASPAQEYDGPYFGDGNFPPGCIRSYLATDLANVCHHMITGMNGLDSPQVDVAILVPVSPTTERDSRIMRQSVEMWEAGLHYLADQMGLGWLAEGIDFHVTVDYFDPLNGEFTTYPLVDPEIVIVATNDVGAAGIGVDPVDFADDAEGIVVKGIGRPTLSVLDKNMVPCHNVQNPLDFAYWESLPGFDSHHESRSGTYVEDCGGAGGNVCFAVNGLIDPAPDTTDGVLGVFDVVAHEVGHCLTLGHVGDGSGETRAVVPYNDIMAYSHQPSGRNKCVSTLDVEGLAITMSNYLDVNGDGAINAVDRLLANDQVGLGIHKVQVQHPLDHLYASGTGSPIDCPQPDLGLLPGEKTQWTPTPVDTEKYLLDLTGPSDGTVSGEGTFDVAGTLEHQTVFGFDPTVSAVSTEDARGDASSPYTDIVGFDVEATETGVHATMRLADMWPTTVAASPSTYTIWVNGLKVDSHMMLPGIVSTWPSDSTSTWDNVNKQVKFHVTNSTLRGWGIRAPYYVDGAANFGTGNTASFDDDRAPEPPRRLGVNPPSALGATVVTGHVDVYVDGAHAGRQDVDTSQGTDSFSLPVNVSEGTHVVRVDWEHGGEVVTTESVTVTYSTDFDGDGIKNAADNCVDKPNASQADMDGDAIGDVCDADKDGDGYSNARETALGTDPADPGSYPGSISRTLF